MSTVNMMEYQIERENRTWLIMVRGTTHENRTPISHTSRMVKIDMPKAYTVGGKALKNTKHDVSKFFNTYVYDEDFLTEENISIRLINANDLPDGIIDLVEYFSKYIAGIHTHVSIETYTKKRIFGH